MISLADIEKASNIFFDLHWPTEKWGAAPTWRAPWRYQGAMEGGSQQGVYALLGYADEVIYIGVGASLRYGLYEGAGLNARTAVYSRRAPNQRGVSLINMRYIPTSDWLARGLAAISTLGFEPTYAYLAYGLEAYLLSAFHPKYNKVRAARTKN